MVNYEGIFFDEETSNIIRSFEKNKLPKTNDILHCTFKYRPSDIEIFNNLVGQTFEIYLIGYGCDGKNSGFEIMFPDELKNYYINFDEQQPETLKIPHITASLTEDAKASNTKNLQFKPLETPIKITGKFGFWIKEENNEYLSFEPYNKLSL